VTERRVETRTSVNYAVRICAKLCFATRSQLGVLSASPPWCHASLGVGLQTLASQRLRARAFSTPSSYFAAQFPWTAAAQSSMLDKKGIAPLDDARQQSASLSNVTEVYPQIRFITEVRYAGKSESTSVLGLPDSSRSSGALTA